MRALLRSLLVSLPDADPVVHECADGASAVALYGSVHPDVVLMDLQMPGVDGLTAARAIRESDPGARIVVVTDHGDAVSRAAAIEAGASGFVPKQDLLALPALLARVLGAGV